MCERLANHTHERVRIIDAVNAVFKHLGQGNQRYVFSDLRATSFDFCCSCRYRGVLRETSANVTEAIVVDSQIASGNLLWALQRNRPAAIVLDPRNQF